MTEQKRTPMGRLGRLGALSPDDRWALAGLVLFLVLAAATLVMVALSDPGYQPPFGFFS